MVALGLREGSWSSLGTRARMTGSSAPACGGSCYFQEWLPCSVPQFPHSCHGVFALCLQLAPALLLSGQLLPAVGPAAFRNRFPAPCLSFPTCATALSLSACSRLQPWPCLLSAPRCQHTARARLYLTAAAGAQGLCNRSRGGWGDVWGGGGWRGEQPPGKGSRAEGLGIAGGEGEAGDGG